MNMAAAVQRGGARVRADKPSDVSAHAWKIATLAFLAAWVLIVGAAHEPWFDEAQAWLIARDSSLYDLFAHRVRYEGTPGLWHALLWAAIRAGLPYAQFYLISAVCAIGGATIVLWRAPFPPLMRIGIVTSYFFAYQFSVLARSYSVDLIIVPLLAMWFAERGEKPIRYALAVGALANLNAHGFVAGAALGAELAWHLMRSGKLTASRSWFALALLAVLGLFATACAWQPADNHFIRHQHRDMFSEAVSFIRQAFVDRFLIFSEAPVPNADCLAGFAITLVALLPLVKLIARGDARLASAGSITAVVVFSAVTYSGPWHSGLLFLLFVFALWISWPRHSNQVPKEALIALGVILGVQTIEAAESGIWDITHNFSSSKDAARELIAARQRDPSARLAAFGFKAFATQPYASRNQFANYKNGADRPSWLDWRRGEPLEPFGGNVAWKKVLDARPDAIVASLYGSGDPAPLKPEACKVGYVETHRFHGTMIWRGSFLEDDSLSIFERGRSVECNKLTAP